MFKHYFEQIQNIEIWPIISLILFFVFLYIDSCENILHGQKVH
jgi:hypothetical protein